MLIKDSGHRTEGSASWWLKIYRVCRCDGASFNRANCLVGMSQSPACKLTKHRKKSKMHLEMARINMSILLEIIEVARLNTK
jgi:hypothetical protein